MSPPQALVVEDSEIYAYYLKSVLEGAGFRVEVVTGSDEVFAAIEAAPPRLVVLDHGLPGQDGAALCRRLRAHPASRSAALLLLSADATKLGDAPDDVGADVILEKPTDAAVLLEAVERALAALTR